MWCYWTVEHVKTLVLLLCVKSDISLSMFNLKLANVEKQIVNTCSICLTGFGDSRPTTYLLVAYLFPPFLFLTRPYWRCYFPNTQAIIYVIDSSDTDRLAIAKDEFHAILEVNKLLRHVHLNF